MANRISVCKFNELVPDTIRRVKSGRTNIVLVRQGSELFALEDRCTHEDYPLSDGFLEDGKIICPYHGAQFDLRTGEALTLPAYEAVKTYPVVNNDDVIEIILNE